MDNRFGAAVRRSAMALIMAALAFGGNASATLIDRGPNMVYDDVLNITWTRQAGERVQRNWADANAWAAALVFGGKDDWRLPYASVSAGTGPITTLPHGLFPCTGAGGADEVACRDNEMAYMFYYNLGGKEGDNKTGTRTAVGGEEITGIQPYYWSGTELDSGLAWSFYFGFGLQAGNSRLGNLSPWAVRPGDVGASPTIPSAPKATAFDLPVRGTSPIYLTTQAGGVSSDNSPGTFCGITIGAQYFDPCHQPNKANYAIDLSSTNATVVAAKAGTVVSVNGNSVDGLTGDALTMAGKCKNAGYPCIVLSHGDGLYTEYREFTTQAINVGSTAEFVGDFRLAAVFLLVKETI